LFSVIVFKPVLVQNFVIVVSFLNIYYHIVVLTWDLGACSSQGLGANLGSSKKNKNYYHILCLETMIDDLNIIFV